MKRILTVLFFVGCCTFARAQNGVIKYEADVVVDNDAFYFLANEDRYYSSGIYLSFRRLLSAEAGLYKKLNRKDNLLKLTQGFHLTHLMYTPESVSFTEERLLDRPYAGGGSVGTSLSAYYRTNWFIRLQLDAGLLGPAMGTGNMQRWWHAKFNMITPRGWDFEINNTPLVTLRAEAVRSFRISEELDLSYESGYEFGTVFNNITQGFLIRLGQVKGMGSSGYRNGILGNTYNTEQRGKTVEWYFFFGAGAEFVIYNATIEGNLIGAKPAYTETAETLLWTRKTGLNLHYQKFDLGVVFFFNTPETTEAEEQRFVRIRLAKRF